MLAAKLKQFLDKYQVAYLELNHERGNAEEAIEDLKIEHSKVIRAIPLTDGQNCLLAVLPLHSELDIKKLPQERKAYHCLTEEEANHIFYDCESGSLPPFGEPYGVQVIVDKDIEKLTEVYFESGCHNSKIYMTIDDFCFLTNGAPKIALTNVNAQTGSNKESYQTPSLQVTRRKQNERIKKTLDMTLALPELPPVARKIIELKNCPKPVAIAKLSELIARDNQLNAQILNYAHRYNKRNQYKQGNSLHEAITDVLGFDTVSHLAVGISAGQLFQLNNEVPLEMEKFWHHAFMAAELAQILSKKLNAKLGLHSGMCYLLGLLHNFGFLLFGHLFAPEFRLLNKWMNAYPYTSIETLEKRLMGMGQAQLVLECGHAQLGAWLMRFWDMPECIITAVAAHHNQDYQGDYQSYVELIQLTNLLLKFAGIGDGELSGSTQKRLLQALGLSSTLAKESLATVLKYDNVEKMAFSLAT